MRGQVPDPRVRHFLDRLAEVVARRVVRATEHRSDNATTVPERTNGAPQPLGDAARISSDQKETPA